MWDWTHPSVRAAISAGSGSERRLLRLTIRFSLYCAFVAAIWANMAELGDKIKKALDECRILILGAQVLLGFEYRSVFESGFERLPAYGKFLVLGALGLMLAAFALLLLPAAYHLIVLGGEDKPAFHEFTTRIIELALLPFALGLGLNLYVATEGLMGIALAALAGVFAVLIAIFFWYGIEKIAVSRRRLGKEGKMPARKHQDEQAAPTSLKDKVEHVLQEARMVLPGAQALLGFQFITVFMQSYDRLPSSVKYVHLASLSATAFSTVLLIAPAAYHRIVEQGEDTEHFHALAGRLLLSSMALLAAGVSGELFVVIQKSTDCLPAAIACSVSSLLCILGLWFGFTLYRRNRGTTTPEIRT